ncbi:MAG: phosphate/phosphite/phosphonate ABC transporter substrate-binding protein [Desulfobulbaceae bacterium]
MRRAAAVFRAALYCFLLPGVIVLALFVLGAETRAGEPVHKKGSLLIGIEPEHNIFDQVRRYRSLAEYLSDQLGMEVKLTIMSRYGEVLKRFRSLHLDGAVLSAYTATMAIDELGLIPLANQVDKDGDATSTGYIFVRKDSGIRSVADMRGRSIVFVDPATAEGYLFARAFFRRNNIENLDGFFSRHYFSGSHASAIFAVLDGRADIGVAKNTVFNRLASRDRSIRHELLILAKSPPVPEVTICLQKNLPPQTLEKIRETLLAMTQSVEGRRVLKELGARRFVAAGPEAFSGVREMAREAGVQGAENNGR